MAEIEAAILEEREARQGLGLKEAFFGKGNGIRFFIAFFIFVLQQFAGQNSVKWVPTSLSLVGCTDFNDSYYAPRIFKSVCFIASFR